MSSKVKVCMLMATILLGFIIIVTVILNEFARIGSAYCEVKPESTVCKMHEIMKDEK